MQAPHRPLESFLNALQAKTPLAFSRWGDGEWHSVLGRTKGANCDGHRYWPALGRDLREVLMRRPRYALGMQSLAQKLMGAKIDEWLRKNRALTLDWVDADVFHKASMHGQLKPLIDVIRGMPFVLVGPQHLEAAKAMLQFTSRVDVHPTDAYSTWRTAAQQTIKAMRKLPVGSLAGVCAGMPGKLLVDEIFKQTQGKHQVIDFGSVFDPYAGKKSRRYMQDLVVDYVPDA